MKPVGTATRALLAGIVDYAGLFPPAQLELAAAVRAYAAARRGPHAWMLGRFVLPAARSDEFAAACLAEWQPLDGAWEVSLLAADVPAAQAAIERLRAACGSRVAVASVEFGLLAPAGLDAALARLRELPTEIETYFEMPLGAERGACLARLGVSGARAKIRTGGLHADAVPGAAELAGFLSDCARAELPFKATAGLHHACRAEYRLTYAPDSPTAVMHGFANLAAAAALAFHAQADVATLERVLLAPDPLARLGDDGLHYAGGRLDCAALAECRARFFRSFGSCSFDEPATEIAARLGA